MNTIIKLLLLGLSALPISGKTQVYEGADFYLDKILKKLRAQSGAQALTGTLVLNGKVAAFGATGIRKQGHPAIVTENDLFAIGSVTKTITGMLAAKLIEENSNNLSWDSRISDLYPALATINAQGINSTLGELMRFRAFISRDRLTHASCSQNNFINSPPIYCQPGMQEVTETCDKTNLESYQFCGRNEFVNKILRLTIEPNILGKYNNNTPVVVSAMLQKATNRTYENLLKDELFIPLGMLSAKLFSQITDVAANQVQLPFGHNSNIAVESYKSDWNRFHVGHASGGIMLTPIEMGRYLIELMPGSDERKKILSDASLVNYFSGDMGVGSKVNGGWYKETVPNKVKSISWLTADTGYWHDGGIEGFSTRAFVFPEKNFGYFCISTGNSTILDTLQAQLINMWYQQDFLPVMPKAQNGTVSNATNLAKLLDNDFLTTWTSSVTNDVIIAKPEGTGILGIVPFKSVYLAYPRNQHNIDHIQIYVKDNNNVDTLLAESVAGTDNTLFVFEQKVFTKELRIKFINKNNKKTKLSEIKLTGQSNDPRINEPIEVIRDPVRLKKDPIIYIKTPAQLQKPIKQQ